MCAAHLHDFLDTQSKQWLAAGDESEFPIPMVCCSCSQEISDRETPVPLFATVFAKGSMRSDYYGALHPDCVDAYAEEKQLEGQYRE